MRLSIILFLIILTGGACMSKESELEGYQRDEQGAFVIETNKLKEDGLYEGNSTVISVLERRHYYKLVDDIANAVVKKLANSSPPDMSYEEFKKWKKENK